jgi:hypothetical protein
MKHAGWIALLLACRATKEGPPSVPAGEPAPDTSAVLAVEPYPVIAHASGSRGTIDIVICVPLRGEKSLGTRFSAQGLTTGPFILEGADPSTTQDKVRFVDVDGDGYPDPVVATSPPGSSLVVANVFLSTQVDTSKAWPGCTVDIPVDRGSEGFLLSAHTLDEAGRALAAVPHRGLTQEEVCRYSAASDPAKVSTYSFLYAGLVRRIDAPRRWALCDQKVADGPEVLHPSAVCDAFRPYCTFGMASGDTIIPASESRLWFDLAAKRLAVAAWVER